MNFAPLDFTDYQAIVFGLFGVALLLGFILFGIDQATGVHNEGNNKTKAGKASIAIITLTVIACIGSMSVMIASFPVKNNNNSLATQNIMEKYDVREIHWNAKETEVRSNGSKEKDSTGEVLITLPNNEKQLFLYEVNKDTSEPTLKDSPLHGKTNADALLKSK